MSIIKKAKELAPPTTLVLGSNGSGKSSLVRDEILKANWKALWVAFNNTAALTDGAEKVSDWAVAVPSTWAEFSTEIIVPAVKGDFKEYNTLVLDGISVAAALALGSIVGTKTVTTQADWGDASELIRDAIVKLRGQFDRVFVTVDVVADNAGALKTALNPYLHNLITTLCGERWYTYAQPVKDAKAQITGLAYGVQRNSILALKFTPNPAKV